MIASHGQANLGKLIERACAHFPFVSRHTGAGHQPALLLSIQDLARRIWPKKGGPTRPHHPITPSPHHPITPSPIRLDPENLAVDCELHGAIPARAENGVLPDCFF